MIVHVRFIGPPLRPNYCVFSIFPELPCCSMPTAGSSQAGQSSAKDRIFGCPGRPRPEVWKVEESLANAETQSPIACAPRPVSWIMENVAPWGSFTTANFPTFGTSWGPTHT